MFKKLFCTLLAIVPLVLILIALPKNIVHAADAETINFGQTITGNITDTSYKSTYKIVLDKPGKIDINLESQVSSGLMVNLTDSTSKLVDFNFLFDGSEQSPKDYSSSHDFDAGTYYFTVQGMDINDAVAAGSYTLIVNYTGVDTNDVEPNNSTDNAQTLDLNAEAIKGYLPWNDDQDIYKIVLPSAGKIDVNVNAYMYIPCIELSDSNGEKIFHDYTGNGNEENPAIYTKSADLEAGTYYIKIASVGSGTGKYNIKVNYTAADNNDIEPNNDNKTAQSLILNSKPIIGYFSWNDNVDVYKITLPKAGSLNIDVTSQISETDIRLENESGDAILDKEIDFSSSEEKGEYTSSLELEKGTYYLKIHRNYGRTGKYSVKADYTGVDSDDVEPNNTMTNAQPLVLNTNPINGYLPSNDEKDMYKILLLKPGKIHIYMTFNTTNLHVNLLNSSEDIYSVNLNSGQNWGKDFDLDKGTYYVEVDKNSPTTVGQYSIKVNYTQTDSNDIEPNNGIKTAQSLELNSGTMVGYLPYNDDKDVFKIIVQNTGSIRVDLASWMFITYFEIDNSNGSSIWNDNLIGGSSENKMTMSKSFNLNAGTYYLVVSHYNLYSGKYTVNAVSNNQVTFNSNGGSSIPSETVLYNGKAIKPSNPTKVGYTFGGWYKDSTFINPFDFNTPLTKNITLYAKWNAIAPSIPVNVKASSMGYNSIKVIWNITNLANGYEVYRSTSVNGVYTKIGETTTTTYTNVALITETTYYYKVRAYRLSGIVKVYGNYSTVVGTKPVLAAPTNISTVSPGYNSIKINFGGVIGATRYQIYRSQSSNGAYYKVAETTSPNYVDSYMPTGVTFYYKIRAYRESGLFSNYSVVVSGKAMLASPSNLKATKVDSQSYSITWNGAPDASAYEIYRSTSSTGPYSLLAKVKETKFTNIGLVKGKTYYYKVRAYRYGTQNDYYSNWTNIMIVKP